MVGPHRSRRSAEAPRIRFSDGALLEAGGMVAIDHRDMPADLNELPPAPGGGPGKGRLNEESVEARLRAEAVEARERCRRDNEQQAARERAAPMQVRTMLGRACRGRRRPG